jgi:hypothetical protein
MEKRLAFAAALIVAVGSPPARAEQTVAAQPCDALAAGLRRAIEHRAPSPLQDLGFEYHRWEREIESALQEMGDVTPATSIAGVTPACRAETRRGAAPAAVAAARALVTRSEPGWIDRGRMVLCAMQDPAALGEVGAWMSDEDYPAARAVCAAALATWPGAEPLRRSILAGAVHRTRLRSPGRWQIDPAVVAGAAAIGGPELLEWLAQALTEAHAHHALGYDRLRAAVCSADGALSNDRARVCSTLPAQPDDDWPASEADRWLTRGALTVGYGGVVAMSFATRDAAAGRTVATAAGIAGGYVTGCAAAYYGGRAGGLDDGHRQPDVGFEALMLGGITAGAVIGGLTAHALAGPPGARAPVTAVGLVPLYLLTFAATFD